MHEVLEFNERFFLKYIFEIQTENPSLAVNGTPRPSLSEFILHCFVCMAVVPEFGIVRRLLKLQTVHVHQEILQNLVHRIANQMLILLVYVILLSQNRRTNPLILS